MPEELKFMSQTKGLITQLSNPSKMPGSAWGIPAKYCKRGTKLAKIEGTVCSICYANKGRFAMPNVIDAYERRYQDFESMRRSDWLRLMVFMISKKCAKDPYFRVFDSGDLTGADMLRAWFTIAKRLPNINFWLVSREYRTINYVQKGWDTPPNLLIRVSGDFPDKEAKAGFTHTGEVAGKKAQYHWEPLVASNNLNRHYCPAPLQDNKCGDCRACWDSEVKTVIYLEH